MNKSIDVSKERLYHSIKHCKKCKSPRLKLISKGNNYLGDFGDLYECLECGFVNDAFKYTKKEYSKSEYENINRTIKGKIAALLKQHRSYKLIIEELERSNDYDSRKDI